MTDSFRDSRCPDFPYHPGKTLSIQRHVPPQPFGLGYSEEAKPRQYSDPTETTDDPDMTDLKWCLRHPPTTTVPHFDPALHNLQLVEQLASEEGRGAQLIRCKLDTLPGLDLVAKIYDPLYYYSYKKDRPWFADLDYGREAAAYQVLQQSKLDGISVPKYYGSWTFDMPVPALNKTRPVRMILIQYVDAVSMDSLIKSGDAYEKLTPKQRLDLLAQAMEIDCKVLFHGIKHSNLTPENLLVSGLDTETPSVVLVGFSRSMIYWLPHATDECARGIRPVSPLYQFWGERQYDFYTWMPLPHRNNMKVFRGWLMEVWGKSPSNEFGPPPVPAFPPLEMGEGMYEYREPIEDDLEKDDPRRVDTSSDDSTD